jgi:uncharacterized protein YeaC (DUF1315 family)
MMELDCIKLQTKRPKKPGETIKEAFGFVRPERVNKWTKFMLAVELGAASSGQAVTSVTSEGVLSHVLSYRHNQTPRTNGQANQQLSEGHPHIQIQTHHSTYNISKFSKNACT